MPVNGIEENILELRKKGYGYKSISSTLHISRDVARNVCKKYGLIGYGDQIKVNTPEIKNIPTKCLYCGKPINTQERRGRKAKFCCDECRRSWWKENSDKRERRETAWYTFTCKNCGKEFKVYGNKNRKFCSIKCSYEYRFGPYDEKTGFELIKEKGCCTTQSE